MKRPEEGELIKYFQWIDWVGHLKEPRLKHAYHNQNEGRWSPIRRAQLKKAGVKAGVPDVFIPVPIYPHHGLYLEFKIKPNKLSKSQEDYMEALIKCGYQVLISWSADEAIEQTISYLKGALDESPKNKT